MTPSDPRVRRSRVVVAGPYPTMQGPEAAATFALVRALVAAGDDVTVVSPAPSAAHHHLDVVGARGALRLARLAAGADRLVVRLDAQAVGASSDTPRALPGRLALGLALRRAGRAEVHLDRVPATLSRRWVSLVLSPAARIVVGSGPEGEALVAAGAEPARVTVEDAAPAPPAPPRSPAPEDDDEPEPPPLSAADFEALLRRRVARQRSVAPLPGRVAAGGAAAGRASLPLRHLPRMQRAPVRSNKAGGAVLKRALAKLLAWQFDWVIQHVNQLHQATIDALDEHERRHPSEEETTS